MKSGTGTGKTSWIAEHILPMYRNDYHILSVTSRMSLAQQIAVEFEISYYRSDTGESWQQSFNESVFIQLDSLDRLNPDGSFILVIDEFNSLMRHCNNSKIKSKRWVLMNLRRLVLLRKK